MAKRVKWDSSNSSRACTFHDLISVPTLTGSILGCLEVCEWPSFWQCCKAARGQLAFCHRVQVSRNNLHHLAAVSVARQWRSVTCRLEHLAFFDGRDNTAVSYLHIYDPDSSSKDFVPLNCFPALRKLVLELALVKKQGRTIEDGNTGEVFLPCLQVLTIHSRVMSSQWMSLLYNSPYLQSLTLGATPMRSSWLQAIGRLSQLRHLSLSLESNVDYKPLCALRLESAEITGFTYYPMLLHATVLSYWPFYTHYQVCTQTEHLTIVGGAATHGVARESALNSTLTCLTFRCVDHDFPEVIRVLLPSFHALQQIRIQFSDSVDLVLAALECRFVRLVTVKQSLDYRGANAVLHQWLATHVPTCNLQTLRFEQCLAKEKEAFKSLTTGFPIEFVD